MNTFNYETNFDIVVLNAFEIITNNGYGMDYDEREHYIKAIRDKTANSYYDGTSNQEWLDSVIEKFGIDKD